MEPVEIEIKMQQNVSEETEKATANVDEMTQAFLELEKALANPKQALKQLSLEIVDQKKLIVDLKGQIAAMLAEAEKGSKGAAVEAVKLKKEYEAETVVLDQMLTMQDALAEATAKTTTRTRELKDELTKMRIAGEGNTETYEKLRKEYEGLLEAQSAVKNETSTKAATEGILQMFAGLSGAVSAGAGVFGLFNKSAEAFEKIQTRVQSLIAISTGLQQVANTVNARSAFITNTVAKAKQMWAQSVQFLNVQLGISNVLSKALVASGIGAIIAAVGILVVKMKDWRTEQEQANAALREQTQIAEAAADEIGTQLVTYKNLQVLWEQLGGNLEKQNQFIRDNKAEFDKLGVSVETVNDAENLLVTNTQGFVDAMKARAMATAAQKLASEKYAEAIKLQAEAEKRVATTSADELAGRMDIIYGNPAYSGGETASEKAAKYAQNEADKLNAAAKKVFDEAENYFDKFIQQRKIANDILKASGISTVGTTAKTKADPTKAVADTAVEDQRKQIQQQIELWQRYFKYVENGYGELADGLLQQLRKGGYNLEDYLDNQKAAIAGRMVDIDTVIGRGVSDEDKKALEAELAKLGDTLDFVIDAEIKVNYDNSAEARERKKMLDGVLAEYATYTEKRIALDKKYAALRKTLEADSTIGDKSTAMAALEQGYQAEVDKLAMAALKGEEAFEKLGGNIKKLGKDALRQLAADLNKLKMDKQFAESAEAVKAIDEAIEQVNETIETQTLESFDKMIDKISSVSDYVNQIVGSLGAADSAAGKALKSFGSIIKGFQQGGILGGIASIIGEFASRANEALDLDGSQKAAKLEKERAESIAAQNYQFEKQLRIIESINDLVGEERISFRNETIESLTEGMSDSLAGLRGYNDDVGIEWKKYTETIKKGWRIVLGVVTVGTSELGKKNTPVPVSANPFANLTDEEVLKADAHFLANTWNKYVDDALARGEIDEGNYISLVDIESNEQLSLYLDQLREYQALIKQLEDEQFRDDFGIGGAEDLLNEFMSTLADSEDDLEKWGKSFEDIWRKYVMNTIKKTIAEGYINQLVEQIKTANEDGNISAEEYEDLKRFWEIQGKRAEAELGVLEQIYGLQDDIENVREGMKGSALARASQDSIDELTGGVYALRMATADIRNYAREQLMVQQTMTSQLDVIAQNSEYLERLDAMQRDIEDIKIKGIKLKV